jgi:hypothetical protein
MKLYKIFFLLFSISIYSNESIDINQYKIEVLLFKYKNPDTNEKFADTFLIDLSKVITLENNDYIYIQPNIKPTKKNEFFELDTSKIKLNEYRINDEKPKDELVDPTRWFIKQNSPKTFLKISSNIKKDSNIDLIDSFGWVHGINSNLEQPYLFHQDTKKRYGLFVKFYKKRFLHLDLYAFLGVHSGTDIDLTNKIKKDSLKTLIDANEQSENNFSLKKEHVSVIFDQDYEIINKEESKEKIKTKIDYFINEDIRILKDGIYFFDHPYFGLMLNIESYDL